MAKIIKDKGRSVVARAVASHEAIMPAGWGLLQRMTRIVVADPTRAIAISLLVTACASTAINAMYLQTIKHPAPLFGEASAPAVTAMPEVAPVPVSRSAAFSNVLTGVDETTLGNAGFATAPEASAQTNRADSIGDLIAGMGSKPIAPNRTVMLAQRALNKLGYAVKADGVAGGTTRQAIEKFERDSRMPVKGDLSPKLLRELSVAAGFPIE